MDKCIVLEYKPTDNGSQLPKCTVYMENDDPYVCFQGDVDYEAIKAQQYRMELLEQKYQTLVVAANTLLGCYDRNPGNFAVARKDLEKILGWTIQN